MRIKRRCNECKQLKLIHGKELCNTCYNRNFKLIEKICIGCKEFLGIHGKGLCNNCYQKSLRLKKQGIDLITGIKMGYFKTTGTDGKFTSYHKPWNKGLKLGRVYSKKYLFNRGRFHQGSEHPNWKGGKSRNHHTYRKDVEKIIGRKLKSNEIIHHKDNNFNNNKINNIIIFPSHSEHMKYHWKIQKKNNIKGKLKSG